MAIIDDYNKKQEYEAKKFKFFLDFDKYLETFTSNGVRLKNLLYFVIQENKKYTVNDLDYTFLVRAEEEHMSQLKLEMQLGETWLFTSRMKILIAKFHWL